MRIKAFEEIEAWKRARALNKKIYCLSNKIDFSKDWPLKDQIRRAAISVSSNIAEGFDSGGIREFARFLKISRRSLSEIQNQLYLALDQNYISEEEFLGIYGECEQIRKMITALIKHLDSLSH